MHLAEMSCDKGYGSRDSFRVTAKKHFPINAKTKRMLSCL